MLKGEKGQYKLKLAFQRSIKSTFWPLRQKLPQVLEN